MLAEFESFIKQNALFQKSDRLLIGVSGGSDSVALCELCRLAGYAFEIAHCNFQLRGEESLRDENFVRELAAGYGIPCHVIKFETEEYARRKKLSTQIAARELRYNWFDTLITTLKKQSVAWLLTAHHQDDNIETLLMNFFKGTGIGGLQGIPVKNGYIRRPLLFATKQQILDFLKSHKHFFVTDSSNLTNHYTRNFFRNDLLPQIESVFPEVKKNLYGNLLRFREVKLLYDEVISIKIKKIAEYKNREVHIPVLKLLKEDAWRTILFEIVRKYGFSSSMLPELIKLMGGDSGTFIASTTHRIIHNRNWLIVTPLASSESKHILIAPEQKSVEYEGGRLSFKVMSWGGVIDESTDNETEMIDLDKVIFPLLLRKWKQGDYFYPLGMSKKKKLSRFFIDKKLSIIEKEKVWIIEQNKKIIWVIGHRLDNRFRVTDSTKNVLVMKNNNR